ncbi:MAG: carboxypeptidase regulatory-like domain-containing protein [Planctomycetia bacterium]
MLEPGVELRGRVAAADGTPRAGVRVLALPAFEATPGRRTGVADDSMLAANALGPPAGSALAGEEGGLRLPGVGRGTWRLQAEVAGSSQPAGTPFEVDDAALAAGGLDVGTLVLDAEAVLEGEVRDAQGEPQGGALVSVRGEGAARPRAMQADARGRFRLAGLAQGRARVLVDGVSVAEVELPVAQPLRLVLPDAARLRVQASPGEPALEGLVHVVLRAVVAGASEVPGQLDAAGAVVRRASVRAGAGEARLEGLPAGRWSVQVLCGEREATGDVVLEPAAGPEAPLLVLSFGPRPTLEGVVLDARGQPLAGAEVQVDRLGRDGRPAPGGVRVSTDAQGRWRAQPGAPGRLRLRASAPEGRGAGAPVEDLVDLGAGAQGAPRLQLAPHARLRVRVQDPQGRPLAGALVAVLPATEGSSLGAQQARCNAEGEAALANLPAGPVRVRVRAPGGLQAEARLELAAGGTLVTTLRAAPRNAQDDATRDAPR